MTTSVEPPRLTRAPPAGAPERIRNRWVDALVSSDPGLNRLRLAAQSTLTIAAALAAEWIFVHFTGALQTTAGDTASSTTATSVAVANHDLLAIAMLLGAIVGLIASLGVLDPTPKSQLVTLLILPVPIISALALGIGIGSDRVAALTVIALVLALGTFLRRFGPRGFLAGQLLFIGYFIGFSLHSAVTIGDLGWLSAEVAVGVAVATAVRFALFDPRQAKALERTRRSFDARARHVTSLALELFDATQPDERRTRRMQRQLIRLNEAALMIDAQLGDPAALRDGSSGELLHQRLFDIELALTNIARFDGALSRLDLPIEQRSQIRLALLDIASGDYRGAMAHAHTLVDLLDAAGSPPAGDNRSATTVVAHRFAGSVIDLSKALTEWMALDTLDDAKSSFQSAVVLFGGWLPGSAQVSSTASLEDGRRWGQRARMTLPTRNAIQIGIAAGAAIVLGDLISPQRFYWAVLAAFITFMGAHNSGEQIRKALFRVGGTVVGILLGSLLVSAVGHHTLWSIALVLVTLFLGLYLLRISYALFAIAVTVTVSQLYQQLGEFTNSLLVVRLEETALGAAVAIIVVMLVLPLHTRRVLRVAIRQHVETVGRLVDHASARLLDGEVGIESTLRSDGRAVDAAYHSVIATAQPLRHALWGSADENTMRALRLTTASRNYSRSLVIDAESSGLPDCAPYPDIAHASAVLHQSMEVVARAVTGVRDGTYARSSALFDRAERSLEVCLHPYTSFEFALHDLTLLDGTMARLAELMGLAITDYDTVGIGNDPADLTIDEVTVTTDQTPRWLRRAAGAFDLEAGRRERIPHTAPAPRQRR